MSLVAVNRAAAGCGEAERALLLVGYRERPLGKELFGTDGIRGVAGEYPLDPATIYAFGIALGDDVTRHHERPEILIGTDTRESGPWIAETVAGGLESRGVRVRY